MKPYHSKQAHSSAHDHSPNHRNSTTTVKARSAQFHSRRVEVPGPAATTATFTSSSAVKRKHEMQATTSMAQRRKEDLSTSVITDDNGAIIADDESHERVRPGSFAIPGIDAPTATHALYREDSSEWQSETNNVFLDEPQNDDSDEINHITNQQNSNHADDSLVMLEAELIDPEERERERDKLQQQWIKQVQDSAVTAHEVVNETMERRRRQRVYGLFLALAILSTITAVIVSAVLGRKARQNADRIVVIYGPLNRQEAVSAAIGFLFGYDTNETDWENDKNSPQYQAANWMALNDTLMLNDTMLQMETEDEQDIFRQRFTMCVFAFATGVDQWLGGREKWLDPISECEWNDITCDSRGRITGINLALRNLNGTIPTEMYILSDLQHLFLYGNHLRGTLSSDLGNMTSLFSLYLQDNKLTGTIPGVLRTLSRLENLDLSENEFTGSIPTGLAFATSLVHLDLSDNHLTNTIPSAFWRLQRLETLLLNDNQINGTIPPTMGSMIELERVELQNNALSGTLPMQLGSLDQLQVFRLFGNVNLTGPVGDSICALRRNPPLPGLHVFETDCGNDTNCSLSCKDAV